LAELRERWVCKEWRVSQQLVAHVWFRGVEGATGVADVLRRVEHPERKASQEVSRRKQTGHGAQSETGAIYLFNLNIFLFGDVVLHNK